MRTRVDGRSHNKSESFVAAVCGRGKSIADELESRRNGVDKRRGEDPRSKAIDEIGSACFESEVGGCGLVGRRVADSANDDTELAICANCAESGLHGVIAALCAGKRISSKISADRGRSERNLIRKGD